MIISYLRMGAAALARLTNSSVVTISTSSGSSAETFPITSKIEADFKPETRPYLLRGKRLFVQRQSDEELVV